MAKIVLDVAIKNLQKDMILVYNPANEKWEATSKSAYLNQTYIEIGKVNQKAIELKEKTIELERKLAETQTKFAELQLVFENTIKELISR